MSSFKKGVILAFSSLTILLKRWPSPKTQKTSSLSRFRDLFPKLEDPIVVRSGLLFGFSDFSFIVSSQSTRTTLGMEGPSWSIVSHKLGLRFVLSCKSVFKSIPNPLVEWCYVILWKFSSVETISLRQSLKPLWWL